jgi:hypothetical protein
MELFIFVFFVVERRTKFSFSRYVVPTVFTKAYTLSFSKTASDYDNANDNPNDNAKAN